MIVGVESDANVKYLKGKGRPINDYNTRLQVLSEVTSIDYLFVIPDFDLKSEVDDLYEKIYKKLSFDFLISNSMYDSHVSKKKLRMEQLKRKYIDVDIVYDKSTTKIVKLLGL